MVVSSGGDAPLEKSGQYTRYSPGKYGLPHMGEVIADYRVRAGWKTREAFAIVCGVDVQTVTYWEQQQYLEDMDRRIFLCKVLTIPPALLGLTWRSVIDEQEEEAYFASREHVAERLKSSMFGLYEDYLHLAYASNSKYTPGTANTFLKHQQELEELVKHAPEAEKSAWIDLLSRYYQHATFIAQHHKQNEQALSYANQAVDLAMKRDRELFSLALYRRSRVHLIQGRIGQAKDDIDTAIKHTKDVRSNALKGSCHLLSAELNAYYIRGDKQLETQCQRLHQQAMKLAYNEDFEEDNTFLTFNMYAVHHEKAKMLLRFALYHTSDEELVEALKSPYTRANKSHLQAAQTSLVAAEKYLEMQHHPKGMYLPITEAKWFLIAREFEESAKSAKTALKAAREKHSLQGAEDVKSLYTMLNKLDPTNPYIRNLGVELGIYGKGAVASE